MYTLGSNANVNLRRENVGLSPRKPSHRGENALNGALGSYSTYCFLHGGRIPNESVLWMPYTVLYLVILSAPKYFKEMRENGSE